jgi:hypothetical protein
MSEDAWGKRKKKAQIPGKFSLKVPYNFKCRKVYRNNGEWRANLVLNIITHEA